MVKKKGYPEIGEFVVVKVDRINPHSANVKIVEYNLEGMVHISEISSGWVRDIRNHIKLDQIYVAKVIRLEENNVVLSLKRVDSRQEKDKIKDYKLGQKAEKMLELAAKKMGKSLDQAYEEIGYKLQDIFSSLFEAFKLSLQKPETLKKRGVPDKWIEVIREVAEKSIEQKSFEFRAKLFIRSNEPGGISIVKSILAEAEKSGLEVKYIAAPEYLVGYVTKDAKKGEKEFMEKLGRLESSKAAEVKAEKI